MRLWPGRPHTFEAQVANAIDASVSLTPASAIPAATVKANWLATQLSQAIPMIGEQRYGFLVDDPELRD